VLDLGGVLHVELFRGHDLEDGLVRCTEKNRNSILKVREMQRVDVVEKGKVLRVLETG